MVSIIQLAFQKVRLPVEMNWTTMILILMGWGDYRGIGLVEMIWKKIISIINACLGMAISLHDSLHRFRQVRGRSLPHWRPIFHNS